MTKTLYKTFPVAGLKIEEETPELGMVRSIIAVTGNIDHGRNRLMSGFFKKSISERLGQVRVLDSHQAGSIMNVLGKPLEIREVARVQLPLEIQERFPDATGGYEALTRFNLETAAGKEAFKRLKAGDISQWSIGYDLLEFDQETINLARDDNGWHVDDDGEPTKVTNERVGRLLEYSPVIWGMNAATTTTAAKDAKPVDENDTSIRVRIFDPDKCEDGSFRTITLSQDEGIKAVVCRKEGEDKTSIQVVIFDKSKGWTVEKAQEWVDSHDLSGDGKEGELPPQVKFSGSPRNRFGTHSSYKFKGNYASAWKCHFSKVGGGALTGAASGPLRGTVRRTEMIGAAMKPPCSLPNTDSISARSGPKSPLDCSYPGSPRDYNLSAWDKPETDADREGMKLSCSDLSVIKRAALAEIKRRAADREQQEGGKALDPIVAELLSLAEGEEDAVWVDINAWVSELPDSLSEKPTSADGPTEELILASVGSALSGQLFQFAAMLLDDWHEAGNLTNDQVVQVSALVGKALGILAAEMPDAAKKLLVPNSAILTRAGKTVQVSPVRVEGEVSETKTTDDGDKPEAGPGTKRPPTKDELLAARAEVLANAK